MAGRVQAGVRGSLPPLPTQAIRARAAGSRLPGRNWKLISQAVHEIIRLNAHTRTRLAGSSPGGESSGLTVSPPSFINRSVSRTQPAHGNALLSPRGATSAGAPRVQLPGGLVAAGEGWGRRQRQQAGAGTSRRS